MSDPPSDGLARLYAVPPGQFVRERNATAAVLRKAGHAAEAEAVRRMRKPSATLWATNQLARIEPKLLADFLDSVERVRRAQLREPRAVGAALGQQRAELEELLEQAAEVLGAQGQRLTPDARRRVSNTLLGAGVDRRLAEDLRQGRLSAELPAPGFEVLTGVPRGDHLHVVQGRRVTEAPKVAAAPKVASRDEDRRARAEAERARRQREVDELARAAAVQQEAAEKHEREVEDLARNLAAARERLRAARRAARTAATAARKARRR